MQELRVDTAALQAMSSQWGASAYQLTETPVPTVLGLSGQASAGAVNVAHADVGAFIAGLTARIGTRAAQVTEADGLYIANEAGSANEIAAVTPPVTGV
ncbi:hypothetical protein [Mycobacterium sherrisii]|uniref:hypothetical protein n=1 Tax=Mycobacterium sherrisii TaxID=243061 RepID=UPI000A15925D|nr:hypothetical protein [Mycobacterium sherrisii]MCV7027609.1 hypothetical protein [Mycobacterium sherrisii]ORW77402.1 hypothetical protein AWC25_08675 [Mycobacterium sherrisii]